jgi:hypothetical protein
MSSVLPANRVTALIVLLAAASKGAPCLGVVPHGHWRNNTVIAGLRCGRIDAPMPIKGAFDGDAFCAWSNRCSQQHSAPAIW